MGYNPLYIAPVHSYIRLAKVSLEEYLALLEAQKNLYAKEDTMKRGRYQSKSDLLEHITLAHEDGTLSSLRSNLEGFRRTTRGISSKKKGAR